MSDEISFDDFLKVDIRLGTVLEAEKVPKSEKLLKLKVDFGEFQRQILAGIAKDFEPFEVVNRTFVFVVNLAPRKMMGLESHGMILAARTSEEKGGILHLLKSTDLLAGIGIPSDLAGLKVG